MGGKALKNVETRRWKTWEFLNEWVTIKGSLSGILGKELKLVQFYRSKESHGDMDILVRDGNAKEVSALVRKYINPQEMIINDGTISFNWKDLQVDLMMIPEEQWLSAPLFYFYNDLGNLIGKLSHRWDLKFGPGGLKYKFYDLTRTTEYGTFPVSSDSQKVCELLDLDYEKWLKGFDTLDEVFNWVIASRYFNPYWFLEENLNAVTRKRDFKRPNFVLFQEKIKGILGNYENEVIDRKVLEEEIQTLFPNMNFSRIRKLYKLRDERKKISSDKFNGKMVIEKFGLSGHEIGKAIKLFKSQFPNNFDRSISRMTETEIWNLFKEVNSL